MANFSDMKILLAEWFNDKPHLSAMLPVFLKYGQKSLESRVVLPEMQTSITGHLLKGQSSIELPFDLLHISFLLIEEKSNRHKIAISYEKKDYMNYFYKENSLVEGIPSNAVIFGNKIYLDKLLENDCTFILGYYKSLPYFYPDVVQIPTGLSLTPTTGSLPNGTYAYRISAFNGWGETIPCDRVSIVTSGGVKGIDITWKAVSGAIGYKVYGRTTGAEQYMTTVYTNRFIDRGTITPAGAMPTSNTTQPTDSSTNAWSLKAEKALMYASLVEAIPYLEGEARGELWVDKLNAEIRDLKKYFHVIIDEEIFLKGS